MIRSDAFHLDACVFVFLADENMPSNLATVLSARGHAVRFVQESGFGLPDLEVLGKAVELDAVLLTQDQDFGRLIFEQALNLPQGRRFTDALRSRSYPCRRTWIPFLQEISH